MTGWWFGTWLLFFHILEHIFQTDFHIFQRGSNHQPDEDSGSSKHGTTVLHHPTFAHLVLERAVVANQPLAPTLGDEMCARGRGGLLWELLLSRGSSMGMRVTINGVNSTKVLVGTTSLRVD